MRLPIMQCIRPDRNAVEILQRANMPGEAVQHSWRNIAITLIMLESTFRHNE